MATDDYEQFAQDYARLEIEGTFYLAYRDLPQLIEQHVEGERALDFGCGAGRSTRFLEELGLKTTGVDNSQAMIAKARDQDPTGDYRLVKDNELPFADSTFDLILASIVFMEIPSKQQMTSILQEMQRVLKNEGTIIIVTDADEMYKVDCASFIYPDKSELSSGDQVTVKIRNTEIELEDYYWTDSDYRQVFAASELSVVATRQPLATGNEPDNWVSETEVPHWTIYVLQPK